MSIMRSGANRSRAKHSASARISRPSASVFRTSIVFPFIARTTSPGRVASFPGMFSQAGTMPTTWTRGFRRATASIRPIVAQPPLLSYRILSMSSAGLIEMPPLSNVMPLPITHTVSWPRRFLPASSTISRGGADRAGVDGEEAPHLEPLHRRLVEDLAAEPFLLRELPRGLGEVVGPARVAREVREIAREDAPAAGRLSDAAPRFAARRRRGVHASMTRSLAPPPGLRGFEWNRSNR